MPHLLEGGKIGLAIDRLEVSEILDPMAAACGFRVGDRVLAVNSVAVGTQDEFRVALQYAIREYHTRGTPLRFQVSSPSRATYGDYEASARRCNSDPCCGPEDDFSSPSSPAPRRNMYFESYPPYPSSPMPFETNYGGYPSYNSSPTNYSARGYAGGPDENGYSRRSRDTWAC